MKKVLVKPHTDTNPETDKQNKKHRMNKVVRGARRRMYTQKQCTAKKKKIKKKHRKEKSRRFC